MSSKSHAEQKGDRATFTSYPLSDPILLPSWLPVLGHSLRPSKLSPRRPATPRCQAVEDEIGKPLLADPIPELLREPAKILLAWQINPHWRALRGTTCFASCLLVSRGGPSSEGKWSRPEPFMHEKEAEEAPGPARPRPRMRSRNIPANSGPAVWSFIVQRADEAYLLRRSPEKQAEVWASDRFQDRPGRRAGPARRSRGSRRCTFPRCRRACARKC